MNINVFLFRFRYPVSVATSCLVMLPLLHSWTPRFEASPEKSTPITLTLAKAEAQPSTSQSSPVPRPPEHPVKASATPIQSAPNKHNASPTAPTQPTPVTPQDTILPQNFHGATSTQNSQVATLPAASAAVTPDTKRNAEALYASQVRAHLQSTKRYPTGREASLQRPSGTSVIWFIIRRNGELSDSGIETSSGSMLLDNAALSTVRRGAYPTFPEDIWPNKAQQRFTVELNFIPAS